MSDSMGPFPLRSALMALMGGSRTLAVSSFLLVALDSVEATLLLSQLLYWGERSQDPDGWIWKTRDEWFREIGLRRRKLESARTLLKSTGILEECLRGVPSKLYYRVNYDALLYLVEKAVERGVIDETGHLTPEKVSHQTLVKDAQTVQSVPPSRYDLYHLAGTPCTTSLLLTLDDSTRDNTETIIVTANDTPSDPGQANEEKEAVILPCEASDTSTGQNVLPTPENCPGQAKTRRAATSKIAVHPPAAGTPFDANGLACLYNEFADGEAKGWRKCTVLAGKRLMRATARVKEFPDPDTWREVFRRAAPNQFLRGMHPDRDGQTFRATLDTFTYSGRVEEILHEGKYAEVPRRPVRPELDPRIGSYDSASQEPEEIATRWAIELSDVAECVSSRGDLGAEVAGVISDAAASVTRAVAHPGTMPLSEQCSIIDATIVQSVYDVLPADVREAIDTEVDTFCKSGVKWRTGVKPEVVERTRRSLTNRLVRERLGLPEFCV